MPLLDAHLLTANQLLHPSLSAFCKHGFSRKQSVNHRSSPLILTVRKQDLLIVSISTIAAGAVTALAGVAQPLGLIGASTLGAMGGSLLVSKSEWAGTGSDRQRLQRRLQGLQDQLNEMEPLSEMELRSPRGLPPSRSDYCDQRSDFADSSEPTYRRELIGGEQNYGRSGAAFPDTSGGDNAELTAIFYDIENLLKGYRFSQEFIENISLTAIFKSIQNNESVGMIATQKAYANWSDPRLKVLRNEINELGIDPIQIFGFAQDPTKNAADIQLVIDAVSLTYTNPAIKTVAIISGDGGFASLVKQLREQGKRVIGCAYHDSTSKTFQAVCDDFISLALPTKSKGDRPAHSPNTVANPAPKPPKTPKVIVTTNGIRLTDPVLIDYAQTHEPHVERATRAQMIAVAKEILAFFAQHPGARKTLQSSGLNISLFSQAMKYRVEGFNYLKLGFSRLVDFISSLTESSEIQLVHRPPSEYRLLLKTATLPDYQAVMPSDSEPEVHTREYYLKLLAKAPPLFKLPAPTVTLQIVHCLVANPETYQHQLLSHLVTQVQANLQSANLQSANLQSANLQSANLQSANLQSANLQSQEPHPSAQPVYNQAMTSDLETAEPVNAGAIHAEATHSEPASSEPVNSESVSSELASAELASAELVNAELVNAELVNAELVNSELVNSELVNSELVNSDLANSGLNPEQRFEDGALDGGVLEDAFAIAAASDRPPHIDGTDGTKGTESIDGIDRTTIQNVILALVMSGCFVREPQPEANDSSKLAEQTLSLNVPSVGAAIALLRGAVHTKLSSLLEDVNESVLNEIVPFLAEES
jgi:uncharacterized LabA/DUF88 family protein/uncharacterized protein YjbI with pentapeptide repeats